MADSSTTTSPIPNLIAGGCWARCQLRNGIRYVPVTYEPRKSLSSVEGGSSIKLAIFYSMADIYTADGRILIAFAAGCWVRCQLRNGIRYVPVASKLMTSLTLVRVVFTCTPAIPEQDGRFLHSRWADPGPDCGKWLGSTPATQRYKGRLCHIETHEIADPCRGCLDRYPGAPRARCQIPPRLRGRFWT